MDKKEDRISLSKLYKSDRIRNIVWSTLSLIFEDSFQRIINSGINIRSLLVETAKENKCLIKELVVEYGYPFDNLDHLKVCLDTLKNCSTVDDVDCSGETSSVDGQSLMYD